MIPTKTNLAGWKDDFDVAVSPAHKIGAGPFAAAAAKKKKENLWHQIFSHLFPPKSAPILYAPGAIHHDNVLLPNPSLIPLQCALVKGRD